MESGTTVSRRILEARELDRNLWAQNGADTAVPAQVASRACDGAVAAQAATAVAAGGASANVDAGYAALSSDSEGEEEGGVAAAGLSRSAVDPPGHPPALGTAEAGGATVAYELAASGVTQHQLALEHKETIHEMDSVLDGLAAWREEQRVVEEQLRDLEQQQQQQQEGGRTGGEGREAEMDEACEEKAPEDGQVLVAQRQLAKLAEQRRRLGGGVGAEGGQTFLTAAPDDAATSSGERDRLHRMLGGRDSSGRRSAAGGGGAGGSSSSSSHADAMKMLELERTQAALQAEMMAGEEEEEASIATVTQFEADLDDVLQRLAATEVGGAHSTNQSASEAEDDKRVAAPDEDEDDSECASESKAGFDGIEGEAVFAEAKT